MQIIREDVCTQVKRLDKCLEQVWRKRRHTPAILQEAGRFENKA